MPSAASSVRIKSSKYSRSSSGSTVADLRAEPGPRRRRRVAQCSRGLARQVLREPAIDRLAQSRPTAPSISIKSGVATSCGGLTLAGQDGARGPRAQPTRQRQQHRPGRRKDAERDLGQPEHRLVGGKDQVARQRHLEAAAETPAADDRRRHRRQVE